MKLGKVLISEAQISEAITRLSAEITRDYDLSNLVLVGVMDGAVSVLADLMRSFDQSVTVTTTRIRSYYGTTGGQLIVESLPLRDRIEGRDVLIVEDILDSGATCDLFSQKLKELGALSVRICALLDKPSQRTHDVRATYVGFEIPNVFVVGYGLDHDGSYRNLRDVYELND
jgi:hypoxanthine phosphoribosyltransferase